MPVLVPFILNRARNSCSVLDLKVPMCGVTCGTVSGPVTACWEYNELLDIADGKPDLICMIKLLTCTTSLYKMSFNIGDIHVLIIPPQVSIHSNGSKVRTNSYSFKTIGGRGIRKPCARYIIISFYIIHHSSNLVFSLSLKTPCNVTCNNLVSYGKVDARPAWRYWEHSWNLANLNPLRAAITTWNLISWHYFVLYLKVVHARMHVVFRCSFISS